MMLIIRNPDLLETSLDDELVLMSIDRGCYYGLENTAKTIWELLDKPKTQEQLLNALKEKYDGQPEIIERDLNAFLDKLLASQMVKLA
ncbi:PqqD family protein [Polynucleobacter sp. es-EL-1]|uniref:PqqD family protein n=1 Tax=Polynucleobacter sp. es-EL-1 TaxID=1855652 RepID=UPI001BFDD9B3|nr:PqqD family protein [Polynucleobacter sp. es-EL-1]QWE11333.1 PqqD family protein [Polynucleobacter sp. es-EL-1]